MAGDRLTPLDEMLMADPILIIPPTTVKVEYQFVQDIKHPIISQPLISLVAFVRCSETSDTRNMQKLHNSYRPASAVLDIQSARQEAGTSPPTLLCVCHSCSAGIPTQRLSDLEIFLALQ